MDSDLDTAKRNVESYCDYLGNRLSDIALMIEQAQGEYEDLLAAIKYEREQHEAVA